MQQPELEPVIAPLLQASMLGWTFAAGGALVGIVEWFVLPSFVEASIRRSREARKLTADQLEGVIGWWKTVIRVVAVSMPLLGFGLAAALSSD